MAKLKKNDQVQIINGRDRKKTGKIVAIKKTKVLVAGLNMVKKKLKPKSQQEKGGIISIEAPVDISNLMLLSRGTPSRVGTRIVNGKKQRYAKKTGEQL